MSVLAPGFWHCSHSHGDHGQRLRLGLSQRFQKVLAGLAEIMAQTIQFVLQKTKVFPLQFIHQFGRFLKDVDAV